MFVSELFTISSKYYIFEIFDIFDIYIFDTSFQKFDLAKYFHFFHFVILKKLPPESFFYISILKAVASNHGVVIFHAIDIV